VNKKKEIPIVTSWQEITVQTFSWDFSPLWNKLELSGASIRKA